MILLSSEQVQQLVVPFIKLTMLDEIAEQLEGYEGGCSLWGYFDKDKLIAVCGLGSIISHKKVWLSYFAVHPDYRRQGLGSKALLFVENEAKNQGYEWIYVETYQHPVFEDAIKFYTKAGYQEAGYIADYLNDDSDVLLLKKKL